MQQYNENVQIEFLLIKDDYWPGLRRIKFRIRKDQLPWWKRNFIFNPWIPLFYTDVSGHTHLHFDKWYYNNVLKPLKTLGQIKEYVDSHASRIKEIDNWD